MSTYRFFAGRILQFARHGLKRLLGRSGTQLGRQLPNLSRIIIARQPAARGSKGILLNLLRAAQRGASSNLRAASMGLWRNAGRKLTNQRYPVGGLAGALITANHFSNSGVFDQIRDIFGADHLNLRLKNLIHDFPKNLAAYDIGSHIAVGCNAVVYEARIKPELPMRGHFGKLEGIHRKPALRLLSANERKANYPLALKMMFNYEFSSQEARIVREMGSELVPVVDKSVQGMLRRDQRPIPRQHENVVEIYTAFVDSIPLLRGAADLYPSALPPELYDEGLGRSKTLFLVMRRYSMTLFEYTHQYKCPVRTGQILLGQLLESLVYLSEQKISHRDIKSNNVLVDFDQEDEPPRLVLSDFGCCLSNGSSLRLGFPHGNVDLGGNLALRPPEVRNAEPGPNRSVDYSKADLWAAGTMAYEIFTKINPFYREKDSATYKEKELPEMSKKVPLSIRKLVRKILRKDPSSRPSPSCAANVLSLSLFQVENFKDLLDQMGISVTLSSQTLWLKLSEMVSLYAAETILRSEKLSRAEMQLRCSFLGRLEKGGVWEAIPYFLTNEEEE